MLCKVCSQAIRTAEELGLSSGKKDIDVEGQHHTDWQDFKSAVDAGCYLCCRLRWHIPRSAWSDWRQKVEDGRKHPIKWQLINSRRPNWSGEPLPWRSMFRIKPHFEEFDLGKVYGGGIGGELQLYLISTNTATEDQKIAVNSPCNQTKSTAETLSQALNWFRECEESHQICRHLLVGPCEYPTRLIDMAPPDLESEYWRLVEPEHDIVQGSYVTLSHRWGHGDITKLTEANEKDMKHGMPRALLYSVYQDAITVAKSLHVRYLWIDSICIMQNDRLNIKDAAAQMDRVYGNALCNISVLTSSNTSIFVERSSATVNPESLYVNAAEHQLHTSYYIDDENVHVDIVTNQPLTNRGWIFQEQVLARRTLYFGHSQILWTCPTGTACELLPDIKPLKNRLVNASEFLGLTKVNRVLLTGSSQLRKGSELTHDRKQIDKFELYDLWQEVVGRYGLRDLTFYDDKLLAVAGVARVLAEAFQFEYVAGLWKDMFPLYLVWITKSIRCRPQAVYRAPSWSWASIDGPVYLDRVRSNASIISRALEFHLTPESSNIYTSVSKGYVLLEAPAIDIDLVTMLSIEPGLLSLKRERSEYPVALDNRDHLVKLKGHGLAAFILADPGDGIGLEDSYITFRGLILQPVSQPEDKLTVYQRVGHFYYYIRVKVGEDIFYTRLWNYVTKLDGLRRQLDFEAAKDMLRTLHIV